MTTWTHESRGLTWTLNSSLGSFTTPSGVWGSARGIAELLTASPTPALAQLESSGAIPRRETLTKWRPGPAIRYQGDTFDWLATAQTPAGETLTIFYNQFLLIQTDTTMEIYHVI